MKALNNITRIQVRNETLMLLLNLYESKGKTFYYNQLFEKDVNAFINKTLETDLIALTNLYKLELTPHRVMFCSKNDFAVKNKDEQLFSNFKDVLHRLQHYSKEFELIVNEVYELAKMIGLKHTNLNYNRVEINEVGLLNSKNKLTREDLEELNNLYYKVVKENQYEKLTVITNYYVDFINMNIFDNFNNEVGLILLYAMVIQEFPIFRYVSFFKHYEVHSKRWDYAVQQASYNWSSSFSQTDNLTEILYHILIDSYNEINELSRQYEFEKDLNKSDNIENSILKFQKLFSKNDLRKLHPTTSDSTIDRTLQRLKDEGKIMPIGAGRSSKWKVIVEISDFQQLDIFNN